MGLLNQVILRKIEKEKSPKKYSDGEGLRLCRVTHEGALLWQLRFRLAGRENLFSIGQYPEVTLAEAREQARNARAQVRAGQNPNALKKRERDGHADAHRNSFEVVARDWYELKRPSWAPSYSPKVLRRLEVHVFPFIGSSPITQITAAQAHKVLLRIADRGAVETARRTAIICSQIFRHAGRVGVVEGDPFDKMGEALPQPNGKHMAAILSLSDLGSFVRGARGYVGRGPVVSAALQLQALLFLRPGELRQGRWEEVNFDTKEWQIPAARMKSTQRKKIHGEPHVVPLSEQALQILRGLKEETGPDGLMFKGSRSRDRAISENTVNTALRTMGYDTGREVTAHGFRATARTLGVEHLGEEEAVLEAQLAHSVKDSLGRSYNRTQFFEKRRLFMQRWADFLDDLAADRSNVYSLRLAA